jgi:hypothetical protein
MHVTRDPRRVVAPLGVERLVDDFTPHLAVVNSSILPMCARVDA